METSYLLTYERQSHLDLVSINDTPTPATRPFAELDRAHNHDAVPEGEAVFLLVTAQRRCIQ
jgi:hypothetical protein